MKKKFLAAIFAASTLAGVTLGMVVPATPAAAIPVFDASNYAQNLLTAARTLQQVNQQIQSLQNEAQMLTNMSKHLSKIDFPQLQQISQKLQAVDRLMGQAQGIDFKIDELDTKLRALYPDAFDRALRSDTRVAGAKARLDAAMDGFKRTMTVQAQVVENVRDDAQTLAALVAKSQGAEGSLQAQQATNQLLALTAKQQFQLQSMMAAQFRGEALEQARRVQAEQEGRAATRRFLGTGQAYTPR
ncbi:P-type conjugative transfer protein TrbJ [Sphingosinicella rhizophila]|uniref:P-type conjugative transfer protein TrbJ n=1 Tax=Sphingosinicella rhizophila TaxID=3050082 RepID=A0ABU3Q5A5_9SPHN|nr:P-type conjugative transfer protein TrbJ [Sphingosinicella sp. GR2756]MDT9598596.1 P-type conjugative transfer protein TrbJ [Sphingosinicella sp. GR2756]